MNIKNLIPQISGEEITPLVCKLLEIIQLQSEEIQHLKDEIAKLKGHKPKPTIKPSNLIKDTGKESKDKKANSNHKKKSKTQDIKIHEEIPLHPDNLPEGSKLIDYKDYIVQEIKFHPWNICYRRGRYQTPNGEYVIAKLPEEVEGHFGGGLVSFILYQYYGCHVTQPLVAEQVNELGIDISEGEINNILIEKKEFFHQEKEEILETALKLCSYINVDDRGARHDGKNGYCTHIGNEYFAWFKSTESKSRINFLELLRHGHKGLIINDDALEYMSLEGLPLYQLKKIEEIQGKTFKDDNEWRSYLKAVDIRLKQHVRIATEGALVGSIIFHGFNKELAIISDDAGQFNVFLHGLCWVHAERTIHKLIGYTEEHQKLVEEVRTAIWQFYRDLKDYRLNPKKEARIALEKEFDKLFTQKTGFITLDQALKRLYKNKSELLLVLYRPDIPLHNNLSENDIREYVKRRKISGSTRSGEGKKCRDTFTSLKKTCRKLGISFWEYLEDRVRKRNNIFPLAEIMRVKVSGEMIA